MHTLDEISGRITFGDRWNFYLFIYQVFENANEKYLQLSAEEKLKALTCQMVALLCDGDGVSGSVPLSRLQAMFTRKYGRPLTPLDYECDSIEALMKLLPHAIQVGDLEIIFNF